MRFKLRLVRAHLAARAPIFGYRVAVLSIILALIPVLLLSDVVESRLVVFTHEGPRWVVLDLGAVDDIFDNRARWSLTDLGARAQEIELKPRLVTSDLRVRLQAAIHGIGIALLPEQVVFAPLKDGLIERVLPDWSGAKNIVHLVYPTPRGMLPSVRSLIDYLLIYIPAWLQERSIGATALAETPGDRAFRPT